MKENERKALGVIVLVAFGLVFAIGAAVDKNYLDSTGYLWTFSIMSIVAIFLTFALAEKLVAGAFKGFAISKLMWGALSAVALYMGHKFAVADINEIFHHDAAALPLTLAAATAIHAFTFLKWPFIIACLLAFLGLLGMFFGNAWADVLDDMDRFAQGAILLGVFICCGVVVGMIQIRSEDKQRLSIIYRIAHSTDFNNRTDCAGINETTHSVLYIGPDQRRVMIAPKIAPAGIFDKRPELFQPVTIPPFFPIIDCVWSPEKVKAV